MTVAAADGTARELTARRGIVIATGTDPAVPPVPGLAGTPFWTNREAAEAEQVPQSLIVLGGGPVGAELSQVFARFGARVTVIEAQPRLLPAAEPKAGDLLAAVLAAEGIDVRTGIPAADVSHDGRQFTVSLDGEEVTAERLLVATGRRTRLAGRRRSPRRARRRHPRPGPGLQPEDDDLRLPDLPPRDPGRGP